MSNQEIKLFISYSHKDEHFRESLEEHLSLLVRNNIVSSWSDRKIIPGKSWKGEIDDEIKSADIILLLVSTSFIASDYCYDKELEIAMQKHESKQAIVIPIIVRPTEFLDTPFSSIQALPKDAKAVSTWNDQDEAWINVTSGIKLSVLEIHSLRERRDQKNNMNGSLEFRKINSLLVVALDNLDDAFNAGNTYQGVSSGIHDLDLMTGGFYSSQMVTVSGRSDIGASDLSLQIATYASAVDKNSVAYFSIDLSADRLIRKMLSSYGEIMGHNLVRGELYETDWPKLTYAVNLLKDAPIHIYDSISLSINELIEKARKIHSEEGLKLIVVDDLGQLILNSKDVDSSYNASKVSRLINRLSRELEIPIIVNCTVNNEVDGRANKRPVMSDLSKWGSLSDDSDTVVFVYRDEFYNEESENKGIAEIILAKNASDGPVGTVRLHYNPYSRRFGSKKELP
ncbi:MAG: DnaB-like helicase C-terminal domain-containing protein [Motiliproteus sp.]